MTTPALVVLPVVVKFVALSLQSDRWLWRASTLMHEWCMAQGAWRDAHVLSALTNVGDSCVLKRAKTSSHDITIDPRYSLDLTIKFLQERGRSPGEEGRGLGRRGVPGEGRGLGRGRVGASEGGGGRVGASEGRREGCRGRRGERGSR